MKKWKKVKVKAGNKADCGSREKKYKKERIDS
jgi:hypothetical protein